jgi:hypothetical protein
MRMGNALSCRLCNRSGLTFLRSETESELASTNEKFERKDVGRTGCLVKREAACECLVGRLHGISDYSCFKQYVRFDQKFGVDDTLTYGWVNSSI